MYRHRSRIDLQSRRKIRRRDMTVCIATICNNGRTILGASDRMVSDSMTRSTPFQAKIHRFNYNDRDTVVMMVAGNVPLQDEILELVRAKGMRRNAPERLTVRESLDMYCETFQDIFLRKAETSVLIPQGLTRETYITRQRDGSLHQTTIEYLTQALAEFHKNFKEDEDNIVEAIIAGFDDEGAHLYALKYDDFECYTNTGYVAIGIGGWHATSQFMAANYSREWHYADATFLLYKAKKRSEIAEGISQETDLFALFPKVDDTIKSPFVPMGAPARDQLHAAYEVFEDSIGELESEIRESLRKFNRENYAQSKTKEQTTDTQSEITPEDEPANDRNSADDSADI